MGNGTVLSAARAFARRDPVNGAAALRDVEPRPVHPSAAFAVGAFLALAPTTVGGMDSRAIALPDIESFGRVFGEPLTRHDAAIVLAMDSAARNEARPKGGDDV